MLQDTKSKLNVEKESAEKQIKELENTINSGEKEINKTSISIDIFFIDQSTTFPTKKDLRF